MTAERNRDKKRPIYKKRLQFSINQGCGRAFLPTSFFRYVIRANKFSLLQVHSLLQSYRCSLLKGHRLFAGALRFLAILEQSPDRHQNLSRQGDYPYPSHPFAALAESGVEPLAQLALWLISEPAPSDLDCHAPNSAIARFAYPLFAFAVAAIVRNWR